MKRLQPSFESSLSLPPRGSGANVCPPTARVLLGGSEREAAYGFVAVARHPPGRAEARSSRSPATPCSRYPRAATAAGRERRAPWPPELSECVCARAPARSLRVRAPGDPSALGRPGRAWPWASKTWRPGKGETGRREEEGGDRGAGWAWQRTRAPPRRGLRWARVGAWARSCCVMQALAGLIVSLGTAVPA